jgi:hypothetical protein
MAQAFRDGLRYAGYVEGRNVVVVWRTAGGAYRSGYDRLVSQRALGCESAMWDPVGTTAISLG